MLIHERKKNRLKRYDYSQSGYYFVTVCTKDSKDCFGNIRNAKMILNDFGIIVKTNWIQIPQHFNGVKTDGFIVMPNHMHGIIIIRRPTYNIKYLNVGDQCYQNVGNRHACSLQIKQIKRNNELLPTIIGSFKSAVSNEIHLKNNHFRWQKSYYDRIIRNETEYWEIRKYIINNPKSWERDRN